MKKALEEAIDATPSKRSYLSIIADYHLDLALCELIDNAIDNWIFEGKKRELKINIDIDCDRQTLSVTDNSGGIKKEDLNLVVALGHSRNNTNKEIIGVFGVGSKRAVIAMAEDIKIYSKHISHETYLVEVTKDWIEEDDSWALQAYEVDSHYLETGSTKIEMNLLREKLKEETLPHLVTHFGLTYALILEQGGMEITVNETNRVVPIKFDDWSYPPEYSPTEWAGKLEFKEEKPLEVEIIGGLSKSHRELGTSNAEYGVYFYCNDRLIEKAAKNKEVGFEVPLGKPHPAMSLTKVIVRLNGPVELMPWNSSKSSIDYKHKTYKRLRPIIVKALHAYASMSKFTANTWPQEVFPFRTGEIRKERLEVNPQVDRIYFPKVKRKARAKKYLNEIKKVNQHIAKEKPWVIGLYEGIIAVNELQKLKLEQKNRISLILLDSTLEIGLKEYLLHDSGQSFTQAEFTNLAWSTLIKRTAKSVNEIPNEVWKKIDYFHQKRNDLIHQKSTTQMSNQEIENYREVVEFILIALFDLDFTFDG